METLGVKTMRKMSSKVTSSNGKFLLSMWQEKSYQILWWGHFRVCKSNVILNRACALDHEK